MTHLQLFVLQLLSLGHGRRFLLYLMAVELISGSRKIFVLHGLAKLSAPRTLTAVAASHKHSVVTLEECDSWTVGCSFSSVQFLCKSFISPTRKICLNKLQPLTRSRHPCPATHSQRRCQGRCVVTTWQLFFFFFLFSSLFFFFFFFVFRDKRYLGEQLYNTQGKDSVTKSSTHKATLTAAFVLVAIQWGLKR